MYIPRWMIVLASLATMTSITDVGVLGTPIGQPPLQTRSLALPTKIQPAYASDPLTIIFDKLTDTPNDQSFGILAATKGLLWQARNAQKLVGIIPSELSLHGKFPKGTETEKTTFTVKGGSPCGQTVCKGVIEREGGPSVITEGDGYVVVSVDAEKMEQMIKDGISTHKADLDYRVTVKKQDSSKIQNSSP
ncbi:hypothetical protein FB446DRAFT_758264 [Lentinula raphanica]|nr:hypothetical protein FB446DRAFT_758264 [Lentinula raphanica]